MPRAPVTQFQPQYGDFLYATIGEPGGETPLSLLSALARLGVDPWEEAAELSELSLVAAQARLTSLLARLPNSNARTATPIANVVRLLQLLPHRGQSPAAPGQANRTLLSRAQEALTLPVFAAVIVCAVLAFSLLTMHAEDKPTATNGNSSGTQRTVD